MGCIFTIVDATFSYILLCTLATKVTFMLSLTHEDPNRAPTEVAPSSPVPREGETPSLPGTPHFVTQIKETHLQKNQPLELLQKLKQRSE